MKNKIILPLISAFAIMALSAATVINSSGTYGWTGSPVDGGVSGGTCGVSGCHAGGATTPTMVLTATPAFGAGNTYQPSTTYTITITPSGSYPRFGVNCEIINSQSTNTSSVAMFGAFAGAIGSNTQVIPLASTTPYPPCISHTSSSTTTAFKFKWTSPASGTGYLYAVVNGVNNDGNEKTGDHVSAITSLTLTPAAAGISQYGENNADLKVYPNPATDHISITYTLIERSHVSVQLCNLNGEEVAELLSRSEDRGTQSFETHLPMGLAKGAYLVKLNINGKQSLQKLILL